MTSSVKSLVPDEREFVIHLSKVLFKKKIPYFSFNYQNQPTLKNQQKNKNQQQKKTDKKISYLRELHLRSQNYFSGFFL